ncbi:hypothetical protein FB639_005834, partial [Coemansia asiatica]
MWQSLSMRERRHPPTRPALADSIVDTTDNMACEGQSADGEYVEMDTILSGTKVSPQGTRTRSNTDESGGQSASSHTINREATMDDDDGKSSMDEDISEQHVKIEYSEGRFSLKKLW